VRKNRETKEELKKKERNGKGEKRMRQNPGWKRKG